MLDPTSFVTSFIPSRLKEKLADSLVELLAGSAESLGGDQIAGKIRKFSSRGDLLQSIDRALEAGVGRFIKDYMSQDEDLVEAIRADEIFWQSEMVQDALVKLVSRPSAWLGEERETVLRHFETVLPTRVNRERVDRAVTFLLRFIAEELWSLPGAHEIREAYSIQFQELTAEAQREQVALAHQQLQATTQLSADLRQALLQLMTLVERKMLAAPAPLAVLASPRPYHNLPQPTYTQFIGRDEELAWLRQRLSPDDQVWQIAITGIGGVGKSALALAVAHDYRQRYNELSAEERFEAIVWVSAKEEVLTAFGRELADVPEQVLHTLEDAYTAIARVLEREDITRAQPEEQYALVKSALKRQRMLLIMDNLESVKDDRIKAFLRNLPHGTKAIITSRESLDVADVKSLTGLRWEEAEGLIEEECRVREVPLTPPQRKRIFDLTWGLPLPIKLGIARLDGGESFEAVERWLGNASGELPEYCVKGQIDLVRVRDPNAWAVLFACALFDREAGASRAALGEIADLSLADRDKALAHLQRLFLVNHMDVDRFWILPIVQRYAAIRFSDDDSIQQLTERWLSWLTSFAEKQSIQPDTSYDLETLRGIGEEYPNLRLAIEWCLERGSWPSLISLCGGTYPYAYQTGLYNDLERMLVLWLTAAFQMSDTRAKGHANLHLGRLRWIRGGTDEATVQESRCYLDRAEQYLDLVADRPQLAELWATRTQIFMALHQFEEAEITAQRVFALGKDPDNRSIQCLGARHLGEISAIRGEYEKAHLWLDKAEHWAQQLGFPRAVSGVLFRRAIVLEMQGDLSAAERVLSQALELNQSLREPRFVAYNKRQIARIYEATGRRQLARQMAEDAREIFERLGLRANQVETEQYLNHL